MNITQKATILNYQSSMESSQLASEEAGRARDKKIEKQLTALEKQNDAANGRASAGDAQGGASAAAGVLGAIAAVCMCIPGLQIVGAVVGAVAAGIMLAGYLGTRGTEQKAADLDHSAGVDNVNAEQLDADIEKAQEERRETRSKVQQQMQVALQQEQKDAETRRMTFG